MELRSRKFCLFILTVVVAAAVRSSSSAERREPSVTLAQAAGHVSDQGEVNEVSILKADTQLFVRVALQKKTVETPIPGSFVWAFKSKKGLVLEDLTGDGLKDIICLSAEGASGGAYVTVFRISSWKLISIAPSDAGAYDFEIISISGKTELVLYGKWTEERSATVDALRWDGTRLIPDEHTASILLGQRLDREANEVLSRKPQPPTLRVALATPVFGL